MVDGSAELVEFVAQRGARYAIDEGSAPGAQPAGLDVADGGLQLVLGVGAPARAVAGTVRSGALQSATISTLHKYTITKHYVKSGTGDT